MNGINILIKDRLLEWMNKKAPLYFIYKKIHFKYKISRWLKVQEWENIFPAKSNKMKAGIAINFRLHKFKTQKMTDD